LRCLKLYCGFGVFFKNVFYILLCRSDLVRFAIFLVLFEFICCIYYCDLFHAYQMTECVNECVYTYIETHTHA
jgi:hypothetical protein